MSVEPDLFGNIPALIGRLNDEINEFEQTDFDLLSDLRDVLRVIYAKQQMDAVIHPDADPKLTELIKLYDEAPADAAFEGTHPIVLLALERDTWMKRLNKVISLVNKQAKDEGLWFKSQYVSEAYLQDALRELHALIEGKTA